AIDLTKLHNQNIFISMIIDGEKAEPFSASTLRMPDPENDQTANIIALTREHLASKREDVEADIRTRTAGAMDESMGAGNAASERKPNNKELLGALKNPNLPGGGRRHEPSHNNQQTSHQGGEHRREHAVGERGEVHLKSPDTQAIPHHPVESAPAYQTVPSQPAVQPAAAVPSAPQTSGAIEQGQPISLR